MKIFERLRRMFASAVVTLSVAALCLTGCGDGADSGVGGNSTVMKNNCVSAANCKKTEIGAQTWMAENLNIKTPDSRCYENLAANCDKYGRLYTWEEAMTACPDGWKLPSRDDWDSLAVYVGGTNAAAGYEAFHNYDMFHNWLNVGRKLKSMRGWSDYCPDPDPDFGLGGICRAPWESGNGSGRYGFTALPGGIRFYDSFYDAGSRSYWWAADEDSVPGYAWYRNMNSFHKDLNEGGFNKEYGLSVRCVKKN